MPTTKQPMTPEQSKEHLDQLLELRLEASELGVKCSKAHEAYKDAKEKFELKEKEIQQHLEELNQELPLFDKPEEVPFPFPLPEGVADATLANVAADPVVLGLTIGVVKLVRDEINCFTLGQLQHFLNAKEPLSPEKQKEAKMKLGKRLGANAAWKLFRAIASFTGNRTKQKPKKGKATRELIVPDPDAVPNSEWRDTKVADLQSITPMQAQLLGQLQMPTVGKVLAKIEQISQGMPAGSPPDYVRKSLAAYLALTPAAAGKIVDAVFAFEEENLAAEGKKK